MSSFSVVRHKVSDEIRLSFLAILALPCMSTSNPVYAGHTDCIANYVTELTLTRSIEDERRLLGDLSSDLQEVLASRISGGFDPRGWSSPFAQARYDDLLYTLDYLIGELGSDFFPALRFAVVDQFASPLTHRNALEPLRELILSKPDRFVPLFRRHLGGFKYWQRFGLCASNSPYTVYVQWYASAFFQIHSDPSINVRVAWHDERTGVPMRYLGNQRPIIRRSYLPDVREPRIRFAAPPCGADQEPRNVEFKYDAEADMWVRTEPYLPIGTWYARGFEDPISQGGFDFAANTPEEFAAIQDKLVKQFEELQIDVGLPVNFPTDMNLDCEAKE